MISRYSLPEMQAIWEHENRFQQMMEVEICASEAMAELGYIPQEAAKNIREKAAFDVDRIAEIESVVKHDVIAFLTCVGEYVGEDSKYMFSIPHWASKCETVRICCWEKRENSVPFWRIWQKNINIP